MTEGSRVRVVVNSSDGYISTLNGRVATINKVCSNDEYIVRLEDGTKVTLFASEIKVA